jgi:universal stress protein A
MYQHILVAVGPGFSEAALSSAIERARDNHARLTILHVIESSPWWAGWTADSLCDRPSLVDQLARVIRSHCEKKLAHADIEAEWMTRRVPEDGRSIGCVIASEADCLDVDLVVLGANKRSFFGFGLKHVRNAVCRHTDREVLIAPERVAAKARVIELRGAALQTQHA